MYVIKLDGQYFEQSVLRLRNEVARLTNRRYAIDFSKLDDRELEQLCLLLRDVETDAEAKAVRKLRQQPWRFMGS
jgi:hypothetical protein